MQTAGDPQPTACIEQRQGDHELAAAAATATATATTTTSTSTSTSTKTFHGSGNVRNALSIDRCGGNCRTEAG